LNSSAGSSNRFELAFGAVPFVLVLVLAGIVTESILLLRSKGNAFDVPRRLEDRCS
jgi:hypothetical protein